MAATRPDSDTEDAAPKPAVSVLVLIVNGTLRHLVADQLAEMVEPGGIRQHGKLESALDLLTENPFDLIVADEFQGGMDVLELIRDIRQLPVAEHASVVLLSDNPAWTPGAESAAPGVTAFVPKPVTQEALRRALGAAMPKKMQPHAAPGNPAAVLERLHRIPLFSTTSDAELVRLLKACTWQKLEGGQVIFKEGDAADHMFVVISGLVEIRKAQGGVGRVLRQLRPGACFGEMAIVTDKPRSADAVAIQDAVVLKVPRIYLDNANQSLESKLLKQVAATLASWIAD